ncbi:MAG: xanthine dehydrogenase YagR molybdenum-binding subunit, partial [Acidimicrobiaceae bacterium]|nr:xanthine dehydrogenase YagR molybdenum-binding subunit [Acidimicrobiaceae bacterium]
RDGRWLVGSGVASATYPARVMPTRASAFVEPDGRLHVRICAVDIGTGARTALALLAADEFGVEPSDVDLQIADTDYGDAMGAGGSMGTTSWGWAVTKACRELKAEHERIGYRIPPDGIRVDVDTAGDVAALPDLARYAYGAHFAEVRVDPDTGEVHVKRMLGVFAVGRVLSPVTARSQLIGGMTMGISMALHEESSMDPRFGDMTNRDLAGYHVASCADVHELDAFWLDEHEPNLGPVGAKGLGEIGIVGAAAAIANAVHHATGRRVRDLPIRPGWLFD